MSPLINGVADKHLGTHKFSELSDKQKDKLIAEYGSKADAKSAWKGARSEWDAKQSAPTPAKQLVGIEYGDTSEKYQEKVSEEEFGARQDAQRMAGDHIGVSGQDAGTYKAEVLDIDALNEFDTRALGAGGSIGGKNKPYMDGGTPDDVSDDSFGKGVDRLSKIDLKLLLDSNANWLGQSDLVGGDEGYLPDDLRAKQELINYSKEMVDAGSRQGQAAQDLLGKWANQIANYEYVPEYTVPPIDTDPDPDPDPIDPPIDSDPDPEPVDPETPIIIGDDPIITDPIIDTPIDIGDDSDGNVVITDPFIGDVVTGDDNLVNDGTIITNPGPGSQIGVIDINNEVIQDAQQEANAIIDFGNVDLELNGNTLSGGSQINIDTSQNAGDAIATNNLQQNSSITNDVTQSQRQYNPYTGDWELRLGGSNLVNSLRDQIFASYGA